MHPNGFTFLELMIALAIFGILLAIGIPSLQAMLTSTRLTSETNQLITALQAARMEAIKRNTHVTLCTSQSQTTCDGTSWGNGWITYEDSNRNNGHDTGEPILSIQQPGVAQITGNTNLAQRIRFGADGLLFGVNNGTIIICLPTTAVQDNARLIILSRIGRIRSERKNLGGTCP